jgi:multiple sugar transport system permease protein
MTAAATAQRRQAAVPKKKLSLNRRRQQRSEGIFGYLMIGLALVVVCLFTAGPILASLGLSFFSWDVISAPKFIGVDNYTRLATDSTVITSFGVTLLLAISIVVLQLLTGLVLALLVQQRRRKSTQAFFRTIYFLPLLASAASVSIFMGYLFDQKFGVINYYLGLLGIPDIAWLTSTGGATATIIMVAVWQQTGFTFVLFSAALVGLPRDVLEAADMDGAGAFRSLIRIKLPLISPTIFFAAVIGMINAMQLFDQPYIMTQGGPGNATTTTVMLIYQTAFQNLQFGYGSAISMALLVILLAITAIQFLGSRKLVFYQ